jgi:hypothetical protein
MVSLLKNSFRGGIVDESLSARVNLRQYNESCKAMTNFILQPQGGVYRRPGLRFVAEPAADGTPTGSGVEPTLIPLVYNSETSYIIALLELNYKAYVDQLYFDEGTSQFTEEQNKIADYAQSADVLYLVHKDATTFKIIRTSALNFEDIVLDFDDNFASPSGVAAVWSGAVGSIEIKYAVVAVNDAGRESLPVLVSVTNGKPAAAWTSSNLTTISWSEPGSKFDSDNIFGISVWDATPRVSIVGNQGKGSYSADGAAWTLVGNMQFGTDFINSIAVDPSVPRLVAVGDQGKGAYSADGITWVAVGNMQFGTTEIRKVAVSATSNWWVAVGLAGKGSRSADGITWVAIADTKFGASAIEGIAINETGPRFLAVGGGDKGAYSDDNGLTWTAVTITGFAGFGPRSAAYAASLSRFVVVGGDGRISYSNDNGATWAASAVSAFGSSTIWDIAFSSSLSLFVAVGGAGKMAHSSDGITWTKIDDSIFGLSSIRAIVFSSALGVFIAAGHDGKVATSADGKFWSSGDVADSYNIYKQAQGIYGFIGNVRDAFSFIDYNYSPIITDSVPEAYNPFSGNDPGVISFFQQRLWFSGKTIAPQTIYASRVADFENMNFSPFIRPDDSIENTIFSSVPDGVQWMVVFNKALYVGTVAKVHRLSSASGGAITPSDINIDAIVDWGAAKIKPSVAGNSLLYVEEKSSKIRDIFERQEYLGITGNDLSVNAPDLFEGFEIVSMAFQRTPDPILWCVRDDGKVVAMTYLLNEDLWGWHLHETDGLFKNVVVIPGSVYDEVYFTVYRNSQYNIELLEDKWDGADIEDAKFLDGMITKEDVTPFTIVAGLDHLEGKSVKAFADGELVSGSFTVSSGSITLPSAVNKVHVGLPYTSTLAPLSSEFATNQGTTLGKTKSINEVTLRLKNSQGGKIGPVLSRLDSLTAKDYDYGQSSNFTGDVKAVFPKDYNSDSSFFVIQDEPLPMTVSALFIEIDSGRR